MNWWQWQYRFSIRTKMVAAFLGVSFFSLFIMVGFANYYYAKSAKHDFFEIAQQAVSRINHQTDLYFTQLIQSTHATIAGPLPSRNPLVTRNDTSLIQDWLQGELSVTRENLFWIENSLNQTIALNYSEIVDMFLVSSDKRIISTEDNLAPDESRLMTEPWYQSPLADTAKIFPTYLSEYRNSVGYPVVAVSVPIFSTNTVKLIGNLVIDVALNEVGKILGRSTLGETGYFFIVASDGTIVYDPNTGLAGLPMAETELSWLHLDKPNDVQTWEGKDYLVSYNHSEFTNWNVVALVPLNEMASGLTIVRKSMIIVMVLVSIFILITVPWLSGWLTRPISKLKDLMLRVENDDLSVQADVYPGNDEIQQLNRRFNRMTYRLKESRETIYGLKLKEVKLQLKQKEATIQALQNQINPHLLYNTLDIIKSIAFLEDNPRIATMAGNLGSVYRYTARMAELEVPLSDEIEHLRNYLDIIHVRFSKHFQSEIYIHQKYMDCMIVKLCLQPMVENAVKFAVEPKYGKAAVLVNAFQEHDDLIIEIADNGPGIPAIKLKELQERLDAISEGADDRFAEQQSLGIANVHTRLVLQYGNKYGLSVASFPGRGTVVSIRIPFQIKDVPDTNFTKSDK
ncbi:cache domain-containing protein [Paenibacillus qinlingensis]|uniref:histidine kinase n=1 Tax=Paenibacillus qinlingensis TaxID=1837343 RepID=A0ABU1P3U9_9BACL|nr:cache domain-containing protein [Paenibacillus qinlingensis]MDR6553892.1 two-component system sensor histidine kinase YesM [Paenibacillus qinlingensis]